MCRALIKPYYPLPFIKNSKGDIIQLEKVKLIKKMIFSKKNKILAIYCHPDDPEPFVMEH